MRKGHNAFSQIVSEIDTVDLCCGGVQAGGRLRRRPGHSAVHSPARAECIVTQNTAQFARSREISALQVGMCAATRTEQHRGGAATPPTRTHALRTRTLWPSRCLNRFMLAAARAFGAHVHRSPDAHHLRSRCVAPTVQITMVLCRWHFEADWDGAHGGAGVVSSFTRAMEPASGPVS